MQAFNFGGETCWKTPSWNTKKKIGE